MAGTMKQLLVTENAGQTREVAVSFGLSIGGGYPVMMVRVGGADPVSQARAAVSAGAHLLRLTVVPSPYAAYEADPELVQRLRATLGIPVAVEVQDAAGARTLAETADALVVAGAHMQNFSLLKVLGRLDCTILLERGPANSVEEWLMAAEYVLAGGNRRVVLVAGPTRSPEGGGGHILDLAGALEAQRRSCLPVVADLAAMGAGAGALARAVLAAGLDGLGLSGEDQAELLATAGRLGLAGPLASLHTLRAAVDELDAQMLDMLCRRLTITGMIGRLKVRADLPLHQPQREQAVLDRLTGLAQGRLPGEAVRAVWGQIMHWSHELQQRAVPARTRAQA